MINKRFSSFGCVALAIALGFLVVACRGDAETRPTHVTIPFPEPGWSLPPAAPWLADWSLPSVNIPPVGWEDRGDEWRLVWHDEFEGDELNLAKWTPDTGTGWQYGLHGWGNNERQYYSPNNVRVEGGYLILEARDDGRAGNPFTSAKLTTGGNMSSISYGSVYTPERFAITQGFIEGRMRAPRGVGFWPAFWTLGTTVNRFGHTGEAGYTNWPRSGEIDIMEIRGGEEHLRFMSTIHHGMGYPAARWFPGASMWFDGRDEPIGVGGGHIAAGRVIRRTPITMPDGVDLANEFHVYGMRWDENYIDFYFNGVNWMSISLRHLQGGNDANPESFTALTGQLINLNLAVGGNFIGGETPDASLFAEGAPWETRSLTIDWVRVHERAR